MTPAEAREALAEMHKRAGPANRLRDGLRDAFPNNDEKESPDDR